LLFRRILALAASAGLCAAPASAGGIVSLNLCTDQLLALLAPGRIAALSPLARDPALSTVATQAKTLPWVRPDAEAVLALHPDLVLAGQYGAQTVLAVLKTHGVPILQVAEPTDFTGIATEITTVAQALNAQPVGAAMIAAMHATLAANPPEPHGTAILWAPRGYSAGPGGFGDAVLRAAGYTNRGTGHAIGVEALLTHPPGLLITETSPAYPSLATALLWHPALSHLPRATISPAWLACPGPWSAAAVVALAHAPLARP
jgi:iron complex transport system substrate-binding protein